MVLLKSVTVLTNWGISKLIAGAFHILLLSCVLGEVSHGQQENHPLELSDIMPNPQKSYDKMRPPKYKGNATEVLFHVTVMSLDTIDESSMTYTCDVFFAQSWKDNRLRLPDNMTSEYRLLPIEWLTEIWRPDSFFKNAKSVTFQTMTIPNHYIWLWKDKTILYMVKLTLVLSCPMHFKNYPHDTQTCNLEIESISHTTDDLVFIWDPQMPLDVDKGIELPQLELISTKNDDCTTEYSTGKFTCLEVVFKFKRRLGYYLFHTYVPTCLIVIMSWISFWIKPEAVPARVTLGVTSLLTLSTQHANSQKSLPPVSYIKAIDVFMSGCTVFVFLSLMEYALVNIVMGDIADIEKKKSMGISNLILGSRGLPIRQKEGGINQEELRYRRNVTPFGVVPSFHDERDVEEEVIKYANAKEQQQQQQQQRSFTSFLTSNFPNVMGNRSHNGGNSIPMTSPPSNPAPAPPPPHTTHNTTLPPSSSHHYNHQHPPPSSGGWTPPASSTHATSANSNPTCIHGRTGQRQPPEPLMGHTPTAPAVGITSMASMANHVESFNDRMQILNTNSLLDDGATHTTYYMNRDGCMETATGADAINMAAMAGSVPPSEAVPPPPPLGVGPGIVNPNVINGSQGLKQMVHDVQLKRQKEIRDMMKKKREKAVLVDRISRWLFPTSFILLNIVYWALFGDHDLW